METKEMIIWIIFIILLLDLFNEGIFLIKNGKRGEWADLVFIAYLFIIVHLLTEDTFTSLLGAFSIYLLFGISELKDYEILNKILYISVITYNIIFFAGLADTIIANSDKPNFYRDTAFSLSFWIMLILGFIFFGRKYIIIFRFMSPQYLTLLLYIIAWLAVSTVSELTANKDIMNYIYEILIIFDLVLYGFSGPLIGTMLGMKPVDEEETPLLREIVNEIAPKIGLNPDKIKIRFGQYPILNAMAYGSWFNMYMGVIAPDIDDIAEDELKGIVAHELAHLRGKHTLSLTLISVGLLVMSKLLEWPATTYDYSFRDQEDLPFGMGIFILINLIQYIFIYIFVRMFEAQADLNTKRAGYGNELAKGLYNLESFYAHGREIGLDTMLLCEEKVTEDNRLKDYIDTAEYLNKMAVKPGKLGLLANMLNSHPPSYHRIMASLHEEEVSISREALMPMSFLRKRKAHEWFLETQESRKKFMELCEKKIKTQFGKEKLELVFDKLYSKEHFKHKMGKTFIFQEYETSNTTIGKIEDIIYTENPCEPFHYKVTTIGDGTSIIINPSLNKEIEYTENGDYYFRKENQHLVLSKIEKDEVWEKKAAKKNKKNKQKTIPITKLLKHKGVYYFSNQHTDNEEEKVIKMPIFAKRIPISKQKIYNYIGKSVYRKVKGSYLIYTLEDISISESNTAKEITPEYNFILKNGQTDKNDEKIELLRSENIIKFGYPGVSIHNDTHTLEKEIKIFEYIFKNQILSTVFLKKAVNNEFEGKIKEIIYKKPSSDKSEVKVNKKKNKKNKKNENERDLLKIDKIIFINLLGVESPINYKEIDFVFIDEPSIIFQNKDDISKLSMIMYKISRKFHPEKIII